MKYLIVIFLLPLLLSCDCVFNSRVVVYDLKSKKPIEKVIVKNSNNENGVSVKNGITYNSYGEIEISIISGKCEEKTFYFNHENYKEVKVLLKIIR